MHWCQLKLKSPDCMSFVLTPRSSPNLGEGLGVRATLERFLLPNFYFKLTPITSMRPYSRLIVLLGVHIQI